MDRLIALGTGNAQATHCFNTCFLLQINDNVILCDCGGGNGILIQLEKAGISLNSIHELILTHAHSDHLLGAVWIVRMIATAMNSGKYAGNLKIYCDESVRKGLTAMCQITLQKKMWAHIGERILFTELSDGQTEQLGSVPITFFDIHSDKMKQFGFSAILSNGKKLCCLGDEPYNPLCEKYVKGAEWMLCEAFCLYGDRDVFKPYEKFHSTVKEACELAEQMKIPHTVLWHTEDKHMEQRKETYSAEGRQYYSGELFVPDDLDTIVLA